MFKSLPKLRILRQIERLNLIQGTPRNAFRFNPDQVSKIELVLIQKNIHEPAIGLRKFWRENLPTLKFHNDDINFVVSRVQVKNKEEVKKCPIKIIVHQVTGDKIDINCAHLNQSRILSKLVKATNATNVSDIVPFTIQKNATY